MPKPYPLSPKQIADLALDAVVKAAKRGRSGPAAHRSATRILARSIDKALVWPPTPLGLLAETLDGPAAAVTIRLIGGFVQDAYDTWSAKGKPLD
jgi:hypothetical protein